jgi:hypothetical protein
VVVLAAVLVPHPPILVPALASGAAVELAPLLAACEEVVAHLVAQAPETIVCLGPGAKNARYQQWDWGSLGGYGVAVEAPGRHGDGPPELPLSLTIGRWLLERVGWAGSVVLHELDPTTPADACTQLGRQLAAEAGARAAWLVLGDGSNRRGPRSPGHDDPRAEGFDAGVVAAFAAADLTALAALDVDLAAQLGATGRAAWQVLAGAVGAGTTGAAGTGAAGGKIGASVRYDAAPFGVEYLVAEWRFGG